MTNKAEYIKNSNDDICVVNAARVSFDKESLMTLNPEMKESFEKHELYEEWLIYLERFEDGNEPVLNFEDFKLIFYLSKNGHWTPFTHCRFTFQTIAPLLATMPIEHTIRAGLVADRELKKVRHSFYGWVQLLKHGYVSRYYIKYIIKALTEAMPVSCLAYDLSNLIPDVQHNTVVQISSFEETQTQFIDVTMRETVPIFVVRQRFKHMVGFTYNEVSRRYVDDTPEFFEPETWRKRPDKSIKQGSGAKFEGDDNKQFQVALKLHHQDCRALYENLLEDGVAPEQARMILPQSMITSYYVTGSLEDWSRAYVQRSDSHAQQEIQDLAKYWDEIISNKFSLFWQSQSYAQ